MSQPRALVLQLYQDVENKEKYHTILFVNRDSTILNKLLENKTHSSIKVILSQ